MQQNEDSRLAYHDGCVNALASQGVNVSSSISNNDKVVIIGGAQALTPQAEACCLHALYLGIGAKSLANVGIIFDGTLMQPLEVTFLQCAFELHLAHINASTLLLHGRDMAATTCR